MTEQQKPQTDEQKDELTLEELSKVSGGVRQKRVGPGALEVPFKAPNSPKGPS